MTKPGLLAFWAIFALVAVSSTTAGIAYKASHEAATVTATPIDVPRAAYQPVPRNGQPEPTFTSRPKPKATASKPKPKASSKRPATKRSVMPTRRSTPTTEQATYYKNCDAVRAAHAAPLHRRDPGYSRKLDRDGDGVACE